MAHCDDYIELISAAIDGALSPAERESLNAHLDACPQCRALYDELQQLHAALGNLPPVEVPENLTERIMNAVAAEQVLPFVPAEKKKSGPHWRRWLASAAVLALALMGTWSWRPWERTVRDLAPAKELQQNVNSAGGDLSQPESVAVVTTALPETAEGPGESILKTTALSDDISSAPASAATPEPSFQSLSASGRITDSKVSQDSPDGGLSVFEDADRSVETLEEPESIAPQMARMAPAPIPESGKAFMSYSNSATLPELSEEEAPEEAVSPEIQPFMMRAGSTSVEEADTGKDLTAREALDRLLAEYPMPEDAALIDTEDFLGWETPLVPVGGDPDPDGQQVSTRLEYLGVTANGKYYEFWLYSFLLDIPSEGLAHSSTLNFLAVPLDSGEILEQRRPEGDLRAQETWDAYQASIDTYNEAISK